MNLDIKPVKKESMVDQVENNLRVFIKKQGFKPGDTLPTENELALNMNVSRSVVREALSRFKMLGLVSSNKKNGLKLVKFNLFPTLERVLDPNVMDHSTLHDLFQLRIMLEVGMADALFKNKTPGHIEELKRIVNAHGSPVKYKGNIEHEIEFHSFLYQVTNNQTLLGFQKHLKTVFDYVLEIEASVDVTQLPKSKVDHMALVKCLETGTPNEFMQLMREHFLPYYSISFT